MKNRWWDLCWKINMINSTNNICNTNSNRKKDRGKTKRGLYSKPNSNWKTNLNCINSKNKSSWKIINNMYPNSSIGNKKRISLESRRGRSISDKSRSKTKSSSRKMTTIGGSIKSFHKSKTSRKNSLCLLMVRKSRKLTVWSKNNWMSNSKGNNKFIITSRESSRKLYRTIETG